MKKSFFIVTGLVLFFSFNVYGGCFSGKFTVGRESSDFLTIREAVNALKTDSICGAVEFLLEKGNFLESVIIRDIRSKYPITFRKSPKLKDRPVIVYPSSFKSSGKGSYLLEVSNSSNIYFDSISFLRKGSDLQVYSYGVMLSDSLGKLSFSGCKFEGDENGSSHGSSLLLSRSLAYIDSLQVKDCSFYYGDYGLALVISPNSPNGPNGHIVIRGNKFIGQKSKSLNIGGVRSCKISNNEIISLYTGVSISRIDSFFTFNHNYILGKKGNIGFSDIITSGGIDVYNNKFFGTRCLITRVNLLRFYHNLVRCPNITGYSYFGLAINYTDTAYLQNNIIDAELQNLQIKNHLFVMASNNLIVTRFPQAILEFGVTRYFNPDSVETLPSFFNNQFSSQLLYDSNGNYFKAGSDIRIKNKGVYLKNYPVDFSGITRDTIAPDIGPDEISTLKVNITVDKIFYPSDSLLFPGKYPFRVIVINNGEDPITGFNVKWRFGWITDSFLWQGKLEPGERDTLLLSEINVLKDSIYDLSVSATLPNQILDQDPRDNEIIIREISTRMEGEYFIGKMRSHFQTFGEAIKELKRRHISGKTTFLVRPGRYWEDPIVIPRIKGSSPQKTITFTSVNRDSGSVSLSSRYCPAIVFNSSRDIVFSHIGIKYFKLFFGCNSSMVVDFGKSSNITLKNNFIHSSSRENLLGQTYKNRPYGDSLYILNNNLVGGINSIELSSTSDIFIKNNKISGFREIGIVFKADSSCYISGNIILDNDLPYSSGYDIIGIKGEANKIFCEKNRVILDGQKYYGYDITGINTIARDSTVMANNFVSIIEADIATGVLAKNCEFHHNTIFLYDNLQDTALIHWNKFNASNNILFAHDGQILLRSGGLYEKSFSNNVYFTLSNRFADTFSSLKSWQNNTSLDSHSVFYFPNSLSRKDPNISNDTVIAGMGKEISFITDDIDGNYRPLSPDPGADQFTFVKGYDVGVDTLIFPDTLCTGKFKCYFRLKNFGNQPVNGVRISYSYNNKKRSFQWDGKIPVGKKSPLIPVPHILYSRGTSYKLIVSVDDEDENSSNNSMTSKSFKVSLKGKYTIGGKNPDFKTASEGINLLNSCGVCDSVIFSFEPGSYHDSFQIKDIPGSTTQKTITITSATQRAEDVEIFNIDDYYSPITLASTKHLTIEHVTLSGSVIALNTADKNSTSGIIVRDCILNGEVNLVLKDEICFFKRNHIRGIFSATSSQNLPANGILISKNIFSTEEIEPVGISLKGFKNYLIISNIIENNDLYKSGQNSVFDVNNGINIIDGRGRGLISGNKINYERTCYNPPSTYCSGMQRDFTGIRVNHNEEAGDSLLIINNFISLFREVETVISYGIEILNSKNVSILHNSILLEKSKSYTINYSSCLKIDSLSKKVRILNNIFSLRNIRGFLFEIPYLPSVITSDYNVFELKRDSLNIPANQKTFPAFYFTSYTVYKKNKLPDWVQHSGFDKNSVMDTDFFMDRVHPEGKKHDLHLDPRAFTFLRVKPISLFTLKDIDGELRNTSQPFAGADDFRISGNDARMVEIVEPLCGGKQPLKMKLMNSGSDTLYSALIKVSGIGDSILSFPWKGKMAPGDTFNFISGLIEFDFFESFSVKAWPELPNGVQDQINFGDTAFSEIHTGLSGNYSIGKAEDMDFRSLAEAAAELEKRGICGKTVFEIQPGLYEDLYVQINEIRGTGPGSKVIFRSADTVEFTSFLMYNDYWYPIFGLKNTRYVEFRHLNFLGGIGLERKVENVVFHKCHFQQFVKKYATSGLTGSVKHLKLTENDFDSVELSLQGEKIILKDNRFSDFSHSIFSDTLKSEGNDYFNNFIRYASNHMIFTHNRSFESKWRFTNQNPAHIKPISNRYFHNNMMSYIKGVYQMPFTIDGGGNVHFYHNTIMVGDTAINDTSLTNFKTCLQVSSRLQDNPKYFIKNNIFHAAGKYSQTLNSFETNLESSHNDHFGRRTDLLKIDGNNYSLVNYQSSSNEEKKSVSIDPYFSMGADLQFQNKNLDSLGTPIANIQDDINYFPRNARYPDIGAYENFFGLRKNDAAVSEVLVKHCFCKDMKFILENKGSNIISEAELGFSMNGDSGIISWKGRILPGGTDTIDEKNIFNTSDTLAGVEIWVITVNSENDSNPSNDSIITTNLVRGLEGSYLIGNNSITDFKTVKKAVKTATEKGICGSVVFNLWDGNYNEFITIGNIPNSGVNNTLTIQSLSQDSSKVYFTNPTSPGKYWFTLSGASFITFNHLGFDSSKVSNAYEILNSENISISNNYFLGKEEGRFISLEKGKNIRIENNKGIDLTKGIGVYLKKSGNSENVLVSGNIITNVNVPISLNGINGLTVKSNILISSPGTSNGTMVSEVKDDFTFSYNILKGSQGASFRFEGISCDMEEEGKIINNYFRGPVLLSGENLKYLHNTLEIEIASNSPALIFNGIKNFEVFNNIIFNPDSNFSLVFKDTISGLKSDHNLIWPKRAISSSLINGNPFNSSDFQVIIAQFNIEKNSHFEQPLFQSISHYALEKKSPGKNIGKILDNPFVDFDGEIRGYYPDAGADEIFSRKDLVLFVLPDSGTICGPKFLADLMIINTGVEAMDSIQFHSLENQKRKESTWAGNFQPTDTLILKNMLEVPALNTSSGFIKAWADTLIFPEGIYIIDESDEVIQTFYHNPVIEDTIYYCEGAKTYIKLDKPLNYSDYQWSTGSTDSLAEISTSGYHDFSGSDLNGCYHVDSFLAIENPKPQPVIFTRDSVIFTSGFKSYKWYFNGDSLNYYDSLYKPSTSGFYTVFVEDSNGCVGSSTVNFTFVGLNSSIIPGIFVFPNPFSSQVKIKREGSNNRNHYEVYEMSGKKIISGIFKEGENEVIIDFNDVSKGAYFLMIRENGRIIGREILIKIR